LYAAIPTIRPTPIKIMRLLPPLFLGAALSIIVAVLSGGEVVGIAAEIIIGSVAGTLGIKSEGTAATSFNEVAFLNNL
jgi:hypothetical protein